MVGFNLYHPPWSLMCYIALAAIEFVGEFSLNKLVG